MQLGFVSAILPDLTLEEVLQFAARTGYSCVEVMCWPPSRASRRYAGVTHVDVSKLTENEVDRLHGLVDRTGVTISALGYYPNPLSPDPEESALAIGHIRQVIKATSVMGFDVMNTFVGRDWTKSVDDNWPRFLEVWRPIVAYAEELNVRIGIENCPMSFTKDEWPGGKNLMTSPAIWSRAFEDIPSDHFGLNFDPSHFIWQQMDYIKAIHAFGNKIYHVHAKDAVIERDRLDQVGILAFPNDYHTPKLPGLGAIDWRAFTSALKEVGYTGPVCVEVEDRSFEGSLEKRLEALEISATCLKQYI